MCVVQVKSGESWWQRSWTEVGRVSPSLELRIWHMDHSLADTWLRMEQVR